MRKRIKAIICSALSLILGGIGIQKFYLGQTKRGILYVLFCWTGIPYLLCIIDLIRFIFMSEKDFNLTYNKEYIENINYKNDSFEEKNYKNKFEDAIDIEYSYVDNNEEIKKEENDSKENIIIDKALEYYKLIDDSIISIKDYDFSAKVKHLNNLLKCIIDKSINNKKNDKAIKELDKMLEYKIPTTLKLINSYTDLSLQNTFELKNIKLGIIESIESIINYLNNVLENIEKSNIMDIASDIDVLKSELKKDGYI
ncbi:TM2 domain-containing protein [Brachyspira hyodysenteriae]|uniref:TM2 domain-containing protein n=1 Tax=Brachyspira hyodysenteriae TaxID=159 RepID=UPI002B256D05|nr:TM2 domain-containing protein [Brachyspira hyodysenteriae]WPC23728.1 TM2 domain-containing protein [Brachyspira hyodysenteriae]